MDLARTSDRLLARALALPGAWEDHPWGERVAKVGQKVFLFFGHAHRQGAQLTLAVKLPRSAVAALDRPECEPTGYGLGQSGWVTARYERGDLVPVELLEAWIEESWRAVAPRKLVKAFDAQAATAALNPSAARPSAAPARAARGRGGSRAPSRRAPARRSRGPTRRGPAP
jgi:predicted DNA-binding protein (MmcQ/YjbR family)